MQSDEPAPDTIASVATPPGRGGIGIVRVSGTAVRSIAKAVLGSVPRERRATRAAARDASGVLLDEGIALYFAAPRSYTGEDVLEFHGHGGPVVLHSVLAAFVDAGARLAQPGEYTRRAFLNGRLDLAQAEAVADLIEASSAEAARSALRSLSGEFSRAIEALVSSLTELRALTEAMLDFPEEELETLHRDDASVRLQRIQADLSRILARSKQGSLLREGIHVVIAGRPNVGKSSLLNRLAGEDRAIVTAMPGTTRDLLREDILIEGVPLRVVDTAGLRDAADEVERIGIERAWQEVARADVLVAIFEAGVDIGAEEHGLLQRFERAVPEGAARVRVLNKIDLTDRPPARSGMDIWLSAKTGEGMELLREALLESAGWKRNGESSFLARERHLRALSRALEHLDAAARQSARWELFAEELRLAQSALGEITGQVTSDELLGSIFARFCIGK
ncbi:MAG TPA: tRNA uridine-5-carboxymethylaminomethyl(34) synthesis GTPase MnmE [Burkholderiales bacterium]|nr:tRNA uridine-5-carboxymethylaminomethyl(34) synthesis GTPase MnmE [Burkholderiales bacterium]